MKRIYLHFNMVDEYISYYLVSDTINNRDSIRVQMYADVLKLHKTDSLSFSKSLAYYKANVKEFSLLIDSVAALGLREKEKRFEAVAKATSDSLNKAARLDSLKKASVMDSLKKVSITDSLKKLKRTDSLKKAG